MYLHHHFISACMCAWLFMCVCVDISINNNFIMYLSQQVLECFAFFYFNPFIFVSGRYFCMLLLIYLFLLVDLTSKLYSLYTLFCMCFVIYILLVDLLLSLYLSILINQLYTFFCMFLSQHPEPCRSVTAYCWMHVQQN